MKFFPFWVVQMRSFPRFFAHAVEIGVLSCAFLLKAVVFQKHIFQHNKKERPSLKTLTALIYLHRTGLRA